MGRGLENWCVVFGPGRLWNQALTEDTHETAHILIRNDSLVNTDKDRTHNVSLTASIEKTFRQMRDADDSYNLMRMYVQRLRISDCQ